MNVARPAYVVRQSLRGATHRFYGRRLSTTTTSTLAQDCEYCVELVKKHDYQNFLAGHLFPAKIRHAYFAIRAFNVEIAMIKDQAHGNALTGRIRFQWWRDVLEEIYADPLSATQPPQPVARVLKVLIPERQLSKRWFERSLDARQRDLYNDQVDQLAEVEDYGEEGHSSILYLLLEASNVDNEKTEYAASHVGVCSAIVTLLKAMPFQLAQNQFCIPRDMCAKYELAPELLVAAANASLSAAAEAASDQKSESSGGRFGRFDPAVKEKIMKGLEESTFELASQANGHLERARELQKEPGYVREGVYSLMGPATWSSMYLDDIRAANFNPLDRRFLQPPQSFVTYQGKLLYSSFMKTF